ncbi:M24 family metallopeptidase [Paenibacillus montanisoli]|uniref:M24 family metallopeptidase n=1 Tax=Paenibacillus montanisoli TaxID=2081970 RepID=UPI001402B9F7|nr:Xaa-Pro peptidase family protein [Paenibacillus montanisoli]
MIQKGKLEKAVELLQELDIDMWLTVCRESMMNTEPALPFIFRGDVVGTSAFLVTRTGRKIAIVHELDVEGVIRQGLYDETVGYGAQPFKEKFIEVLQALNPSCIALNYSEHDVSADGLTYGMYVFLQSIFAEMNYKGSIVSAIELIAGVRGQKTKEELALIQEAIEATSRIYEEAASFIKPGMSEVEISDFFRERMRQCGAASAWSDNYNPIVMVGTATVVGHTGPSPHIKVRRGDVINVDFGIKLNGYCSDLQRIYYVLEDGESEAPEEVQRAFRTVRTAIREAASKVVPGEYAEEAIEAVQQTFGQAGYPKWKGGLGHQLGSFGHDGGISLKLGVPQAALKENMVFTIEPSIMTSRGCVGQEEIVVVTKDGGRFISTPQSDIFLIGK